MTANPAHPKRLLVMGDSLVSGYGLPNEDSFIRRLEGALLESGLAVTVLDGGVSGDTTAGGLARVAWSLADKPTHALVELGANDALRAISPETTRNNLDRILSAFENAGVKVLLAGMYAPPNLGKTYANAFRRLYPELASKYRIELYPFFLDGVATVPTLNQPDGIHPNAEGVAVIVDRILPYVIRLLNQ